ncbi:non-ribosomal peptide synthetase [Corallococcus sp. CA053C]|uniref:non-ribosomal peptide synthetase n=1 Tax=Corallococcus sp. CA053C TaxID=2316732 RepID=UPI0013152C82|nr:non-ribosomal peptide synthetase [Corallococcus sp. CA053C]
MSSLSERVAALSPAKRALLERRLEARAQGVTPDRIPRRPAEQMLVPLSFAQQRLWFLEQLEPGLAFYNLPLANRLTGPVWVAKLEETLNALVQRHEALRTRFVTTQDGQPAQVVEPRRPLTLEVIDLGGLPEAERETEAGRLALLEAHRPFDLARDALFRARLLRLSDTDHVLLMTMHHIVSDGWSMGVLYRELSALYVAAASGRPAALPELPIQYPDFAVWQRAWLRGDVLERLLSYWKQRLAGVPALLELPTDRPRPRVQSFQGAAYAVPIPRAPVEGLKAVARQADVTLFIALLAAFKVLLFRYSGEQDLVVGAPIANRTRVELEGLIGFFVNTLVLRTDLSGSPTFREVLARTREGTLEAFAHQDLPFEKLVEELQPERNLGHNPLFQVMFVLQNAETGVRMTSGNFAPQLNVGTSKFDLTLSATETEDGLLAVFEYNTHLFDTATIVALARNFQALLEGAVTSPDRRIGELPLLDPDERRRLLLDFQRPVDGRAGTLLLHELFEAQVRLRPEAPAARFLGQSLSYRELDARANQLARELREQGCGPEVCVALCMERSLELLVGMLGILKAGAAFLPLDPTYPTERLAYMLEDARVPLMLTQERLASTLPPHAGRTLCVDSEWPRIAAHRDDGVAPLAVPDNLAYVIYTSGSTGRPKGVLVPHRGVSSMAESQARVLRIDPGSRFLQFASLSFDACVFELVVALGAGATLCLAPQADLLPGAPLLQVLRNERIHILLLPPSSLAVLPAAVLPDLRLVVTGGEACPAELVARWLPGRRFINAYGPTEGSICATLVECQDGTTAPLLGSPVDNTQVYVLDACLEPLPAGVPGELYLGGVGVTRGYLGRPDLTAERYVPDPFRAEPGARMYRTGDRVRRLPDGGLQYLGRVDQQLKLRGYRIEAGEIEHVLLRHPALQEAVVVARRGPSGEPRLVAYCVPRDGRWPDAAGLRGFLRESLPDFMVPSAFVLLATLPLTGSGKVDRRALPAVTAGALESPAEWVAPRTETEKTLARIWCEVLELERVGIHDDFFELGGHSLLATRVMTRVSTAFHREVPLRWLFELSTVARLGAELDKGHEGESRPREPALTRVAREVVTVPVRSDSAA